MSEHDEACECEKCDRENRKLYRLAALRVLANWEDDDEPPLPDEVVCLSLRHFSKALMDLAENISAKEVLA